MEFEDRLLSSLNVLPGDHVTRVTLEMRAGQLPQLRITRNVIPDGNEPITPWLREAVLRLKRVEESDVRQDLIFEVQPGKEGNNGSRT